MSNGNVWQRIWSYNINKSEEVIADASPHWGAFCLAITSLLCFNKSLVKSTRLSFPEMKVHTLKPLLFQS